MLEAAAKSSRGSWRQECGQPRAHDRRVARGARSSRPGTTDFALVNAVLSPYVFTISPGYLEVAGTRLLEGRERVRVRHGADPVRGRRERRASPGSCGGRRRPWGNAFIVSGRLTEVVGVAEDGKYHDLRGGKPASGVYLPWSQEAKRAA